MRTPAALAAWTLSVCLGVYAWVLRSAAPQAADLAMKQGVLKVMLFYASFGCIALVIFLGLSRGRLRFLALAPVMTVIAVGWEVRRIWPDAFP